MKRSHGSSIIIMLAALLLLPAGAYADSIVSFTLNPSVQSVQPGGLLTFSGVLSITGDPTPTFLVGDSIVGPFGLVGLDPADSTLLMLDDLPFFLNSPLTISSDDANGPSSSTFDVFTVDIGSLVVPGIYTGTFSIFGGADPSAQNLLASADFQINVTSPTASPVPEPSTLVLLCAGLVGIGAQGLFKSRRRRESGGEIS